MKIWVISFTDPSYDRNPDSNYELLELLGDRQLESLFANYLVRSHPDITEKTITEAKATYISKIEQAKRARKLGLHKWVRTNVDISIHTSEDLFESLFGALFTIGDRYIGSGNGYALCNNLLVSLYYDIDINYEAIMTRPITQIKEIFEKLDWSDLEKFSINELGIPQYITLSDGSAKWTVQLKLPDGAVRFLKQENLLRQNESPILVVKEADTKETLKTEAYKDFVQVLKNRYGIDYNWAKNYVDVNMKIENEKIVINRMKQEGIADVFFSKNKKVGNYQFIQLLGNKRDTRRIVILLSINAPFNILLQELKKFALKYYDAKGSIDPTKSVNYEANF
jgi:hypothetical protein